MIDDNNNIDGDEDNNNNSEDCHPIRSGLKLTSSGNW